MFIGGKRKKRYQRDESSDVLSRAALISYGVYIVIATLVSTAVSYFEVYAPEKRSYGSGAVEIMALANAIYFGISWAVMILIVSFLYQLVCYRLKHKYPWEWKTMLLRYVTQVGIGLSVGAYIVAAAFIFGPMFMPFIA